MTELPEDIIDYLTWLERERLSNSDATTQQAGQLLAKYKPEPKTLADRFDIKWTRYIVDKSGDLILEVFSPNGVPVDERGLAYERSSVGEIHVWPEVDGIDPRELLNNGYIILEVEGEYVLRKPE